MRILVSIANHGTKNAHFLERLLAAYRAMPHDVDFVVLSDQPKDIAPDVEVRVGAPIADPWSLPFAHRSLFDERKNDYDLFIYSEDDTLIETRHVDAFFEASALLPDDLIPGFLRYELFPNGDLSYCSVHSHYHWDPASVREFGGETFAYFTNLHSACYMLTRGQLARAIDSGGFLVPPHKDRYDMLVSAAVDPYQQCGFQKVMCVSRMDDFLLHHLPNVYLGKLGIPAPEWSVQLEALESCKTGNGAAVELFQPDTFLMDARWHKHYYEKPIPQLAEMIPPDSTVLSIGCGSGELEAALGRDVSAIPMDAVIGSLAETRGIRVLSPSLDAARSELGDERFDHVLLVGVLEHVADPAAMLRAAAEFAKDRGSVIVCAFNQKAHAFRTRFIDEVNVIDPTQSFDETLLTYTDRARLSRWFKDAGLAPRRTKYVHIGKSEKLSRMTLGLFDDFLGRSILMSGQKR